MAQCVRRLVLAAPLAAVVALLLCTSSAPVARAAGTSDFTGAQQKNTLTVLQAFARAIPALGDTWTGSDFCSWEHIICYSSGVGVWMHNVDYTGTLPEMPASVDYKDVMILALDFGAMGQGLSGTLPPSWSSMKHLIVLDLEGTKVSGTLPPEWSEMTSAEALQLENCGLSGSLPTSWSSMPKLRIVSLSGNHFCGCVPDSWREKDRLDVTIEEWHMGEDCKLANACRPTAAPGTTTTNPPTTTGTPAASSTPSPGSGCEVDGCEVCEGDSAARCARCREGYSLTDEKTCLGEPRWRRGGGVERTAGCRCCVGGCAVERGAGGVRVRRAPLLCGAPGACPRPRHGVVAALSPPPADGETDSHTRTRTRRRASRVLSAVVAPARMHGHAEACMRVRVPALVCLSVWPAVGTRRRSNVRAAAVCRLGQRRCGARPSPCASVCVSWPRERRTECACPALFDGARLRCCALVVCAGAAPAG
uniref:Surface membrane glycoprotein GP46/M-2 n=1 Tax=Leishmania amazonensis TaxID=5659 RepID=GP46_LEIAM|nr:RecName: Full=Surface membrane glycoprotein GP46/M-2; Flags: Precursor [Leishmania amazonensis]AAA29234.1 surface membrane glycoprotein GP46/M-2 [Leishmania amazonensis]